MKISICSYFTFWENVFSLTSALCKRCLKLLYRFLEEDSTCAEYGCSYSKDGSPGDVYCFRWVRRIYNGTSCRIGQQGRTKRVLLVFTSNLLSSEMATTRLKPEKNVPQNQQVETELCCQHQEVFCILFDAFICFKSIARHGCCCNHACAHIFLILILNRKISPRKI